MSVDYKGLINGNINPMDLVKLLKIRYGGSDYAIHFTHDDGFVNITFKENMTPEVQAMLPWKRGPHLKHRQMAVFFDGSCKSDYQDVADAPMTYVSLGHWGECKEIIDSLIMSQGGYIMDEATDQEWKRLVGDVEAA